MKIASVKKKMPSIANATPKTSPKRPVNSGHRRPNSNDSTVPVTAPTANEHGRDLRPALRQLERDRVVVPQSPIVGDQHHRGEGDAEGGQDDVKPERERHLAPGRSQL